MPLRTWTGAAGDQSVYTAGNWLPVGSPVIGDVLAQRMGVANVPGGNISGDPIFLGAPQTGTTAPAPATLNLSDGASPSVVVGPSAGDTTVNHYANIAVSGADGLNLVSGPTTATNVTAIGLATDASLTGNVFLSGNNVMDIGGDATTNLANSQINVGNGTFARINTHSLGTDKYTVGFVGNMEITKAVDAGATVSLLANSNANLTLLDPLEFSGTVNFLNAAAAGTTTSTPSIIGLIGVPADSYNFAGGVLTLFAAGKVTDTLNLTATAGGFGVYGSTGGVVITSSNLSAVPSSLHALAVHPTA